MELKDAVLSALAEVEQANESKKNGELIFEVTEEGATKQRLKAPSTAKEPLSEILDIVEEYLEPKESHKATQVQMPKPHESTGLSDAALLINLREKILVLFEGIQAVHEGKKENIFEAKLELVVNFMEYLLSFIDEKIEALSVKS